MDGPARSGVNPVSMRLAWRGVHLGCVSGLPLLPARLWVGNPSLVARRWRGFINLAMPLILIDTTFWADALTYVLPAPIRRINSGSSTPGWQCMFGPSPYIGVLSPEQRPWRRSCHHRSCRSWCWRWNRIWLSHSLGVSQSNAFEATLWVRHLRLCPLGGDGTLCPLGGLRNPLWAPHSWRLVDFGMPILALRLLPRFHLLSAWTHLRGGVCSAWASPWSPRCCGMAI